MYDLPFLTLTRIFSDWLSRKLREMFLFLGSVFVNGLRGRFADWAHNYIYGKGWFRKLPMGAFKTGMGD